MPDPIRSLDRIKIDSPCNADWDSMVGNDQVRFCEHCQLKVTDLSRLTRTDAMRLVARSKGRLCVRYVPRPGGGVLTKQIPEKLYRISRRVSRIAAGAFTATLSLSSAAAQTRSYPSPEQMESRAVAAEVIPRPDLGATVSGIITDSHGAIVPGATVTLSSVKDHVAFAFTTAEDGAYRFSFLTAGMYELVADAPSFAQSEVRLLNLEEEAKESQNLVMPLPQLLAEVVVNLPSVETVSVQGGAIAIAAPEDPLIKAAADNDLEAVKKLIGSTHNINMRDASTRMTALEHAVETGNAEMVLLFMRAGADVSLKGAQGQTVLMYLRANATIEMVRELISAGAAVNAVDESGNTPLLNAAMGVNVEVVKELLTLGANEDAKDENGRTVLMNAAENDDSAVVAAVLKAGVDVNAKDDSGSTALIFAARWGRPETLKALIEAKAEIDAKDDDGKSALMFAAAGEEPETVRILIDAGAHLDLKDDEGTTALMFAAEQGSVATISALIQAGAEVNEKNSDGRTAIMNAAARGELDALKALLGAGADLTAKDKDGKTALGLAIENTNDDVVTFLKSRGAPE